MHMQRSPTEAVFGRWATTQPMDAAADCCFWVHVQYGGEEEDEHTVAWWPRPKAERSESPVDHPISSPVERSHGHCRAFCMLAYTCSSTAARFRSVTISCMSTFGSERMAVMHISAALDVPTAV